MVSSWSVILQTGLQVVLDPIRFVCYLFKDQRQASILLSGIADMRNQVSIFRLFSISTLVGISLLLLGSCSDKINPVDADSEPAFYPNAVGSRWVYGWYNGAVDSIEGAWSREIVGHERILGGMSVSVQEVKSTVVLSGDTIQFTRIEYVYVDGDSLVIFSGSPGGTIERTLKIELPMIVGDTLSWSKGTAKPSVGVIVIPFDDPQTGEVVGIDTVTVIAGTFTNTFMYDVTSLNSTGDALRTTSYWIVPEVGILKSVVVSCPVVPYCGRPPCGQVGGCLRDFSGELIEYSLAGQ